MNLDYNKLIFIHDLKNLSEQRINEFKKATAAEKNYILGRQPNIGDVKYAKRYILATDYISIVEKVNQRLKSNHHANKSRIAKAFMEANLIFPEEKDLDFITLILNQGYSIKALKNLLIIIEYLKKDTEEPTKNEDRHESIKKQTQLHINKITNIIKKQYGDISTEIILNKITCLLSLDIIDRLVSQKIQKIIKSNKINKIKELKLFYYTVVKEEDKQLIDCNFIYESETIEPSIIETIDKIISEIKESTSNLNVSIEYTVTIADELNILISEEDEKTINSIKDCELTYSETDEYYDIIDNVKSKKLTK